MTQRTDKPGFTMIELLVVIAIIALLVSILLPTLSKAKVLAKEAVCRANIRTCQTGWATYAAESNMKGLPGWEAYIYGGVWTYWYVRLLDNGFVGGPAALKCALVEDPTGPKDWSSAYEGRSWRNYLIEEYGAGNYPCGFVYNGYLFETSNLVPDEDQYKTLNNIGDVSNTPVFTDGIWAAAYPRDGSPMPVDLTNPNRPAMSGVNFSRVAVSRHGPQRNTKDDFENAGVHAGFVDGSVRYVAIDQLWSLKWHQNFTTRAHY